MICYAILDLVIWGVVKGVVAEKTEFFEVIILLVLATLMIFLVNHEYNRCLVIWGVWSVIREGHEMTECMIRLSKKKPALINLAESILVIVLSVAMIMEAVNMLIKYYDKFGQGAPMYIPLMGTKKSRADITHEQSLRLIKSCILNQNKIIGDFNIVVYNGDKDKVTIYKE